MWNDDFENGAINILLSVIKTMNRPYLLGI